MATDHHSTRQATHLRPTQQRAKIALGGLAILALGAIGGLLACEHAIE